MFDLIVCLVVGTIAASFLAEPIQSRFKLLSPQELRAISAAIGLLANPLAPKVVNGAEGLLAKRFSGMK